jgi:hypothetical protein
MALEASSFIAPTGELEPDTWPEGSPGGDTVARLEAWITEAVTRTSGLAAAQRDAAGSHYVYGRAYRAMASRLAAIPSSASQAGLSHTISAGQIAYWEREAQRHEGLLEEFLAAPEEPITRLPGSRQIPTRAVW